MFWGTISDVTNDLVKVKPYTCRLDKEQASIIKWHYFGYTI